MNKSCAICEKEFDAGVKTFDRRKCCSIKCSSVWKSNITKGRPKSEDHKIKIGLANLGKKRGPFSREWRKNMSLARKGKKFTKEHKAKLSLSKIGNKNINWKGGKKITDAGYSLIKCPDHPNRNSSNYVLEHRLVMEKHIGRYLRLEEVVHHINEIKDDNRIENLLLLPNVGAHTALHKKLRHKRQN